jgi:hypothetical protein
MAMETFFASPERDGKEIIETQHLSIGESEYINKLINTLPFVAAILNSKRQIVFSNDVMLEKLDIENIDNILGSRPGEAFKCINANTMPGGCGTSKACKYCGAVMAIVKSCETQKKSSFECRISSKDGNKKTAYDFKVTASPLEFNGEEFTIFVLSDISGEKRKKSLERIFFHDVLNKSGVISGYLNFLEKAIDNKEKLKEYLKTAKEASKELNEEIMAQNILSQAEDAEDLAIDEQQYNNIDLIEKVSSQALKLKQALGKHLEIDSTSQFLFIKTDGLILKRILLNMLKNAFENLGPGETVVIGSKQIQKDVRFYVRNSADLNEEVLSQIFQRSFSTKGSGRGIGTYSIRLLSENYLGGHADYYYDEKNKQITFYVDLPSNMGF